MISKCNDSKCPFLHTCDLYDDKKIRKNLVFGQRHGLICHDYVYKNEILPEQEDVSEDDDEDTRHRFRICMVA